MYNLTKRLDKKLLEEMNNPNIPSHKIIQIYAIIIEPVYKWLNLIDKQKLSNEDHEI